MGTEFDRFGSLMSLMFTATETYKLEGRFAIMIDEIYCFFKQLLFAHVTDDERQTSLQLPNFASEPCRPHSFLSLSDAIVTNQNCSQNPLVDPSLGCH